MADEDNKEKAIPNEELPRQRFAGPGFYYGGVGVGSATGKTEWPELVGLTCEEAERRIKEEKPGANVHVIPQDCTTVTMDYRLDRVRIYVDSGRKVSRAPMIG